MALGELQAVRKLLTVNDLRHFWDFVAKYTYF
jgi:hypothetical protein